MTIGERIRTRRKELGLTAENLAEKLGISRATMYRYESGEIEKIPVTMLEPLAKALNTNPAYLMGDDWTEFNTKQTIADRLNQIMSERNLKQVDILELCQPYCKKFNVKLNKNDLSQYVSGKVVPKQDKLSILSMALDVNEVWLMGYNLPSGRKELQQIENKLSQESNPFDMIQRIYGSDTVDAVNLFTQLDDTDKGKIIGRMETMLEDDKYQKGLDEKAI